MHTEIYVAFIGAAATLLAAIIGAYATVRKDKQGAVSGALTRRYGLGFGIIAVGMILAAVVLALGYRFGVAANARSAELERRAEVGKQMTSYSVLLDDGLKKQKRYVIPSIVMLVTLERSVDGKSIISDRHIFYQLQALTDISKDPSKNGGAFKEEYHSHYDVDQVAGADPEHIIEDRPGMKRWNVWFDMAKGERHAVVTGAHVVMPIRLKSPRPPEHMFDGLGPTEDAFCYPNDDGDVIEEFLIIVQSGSLDLFLPTDGDDDAVIQHGVEKRSVHADLFLSKASSHTHKSLVARFSNIQKDDVVGLRVGWKLAAH